jgi:hypothetical protein
MKKKIIVGITILFSFIFLVYAINTLTEGFRVVKSTSVMISDSGGSIPLTPSCKGITNSESNDIFVPTKTDAEWDAFLANKPASVTIGDCGIWGSPVLQSQTACGGAGSVSGSIKTVASDCAPTGITNTYTSSVSCSICSSLSFSSCNSQPGCFWESELMTCIGNSGHTRYNTYQQNCEVATYSWKSTYGSCSVSACGQTGTRSRTSYYCERANDGANLGTACGVYPGCDCSNVPPSSISCQGTSCPPGYICTINTCEPDF